MLAVLYSNVLCPFSRMAHLLLSELSLPFTVSWQKPWKDNKSLLKINPNLSLPVLQLEDGTFLVGFYPISEFLAESLLPGTPVEKAEIRRLIAWFNGALWQEVTHPFLFEKKEKMTLKSEQGGGPPDLRLLRAALARLDDHLDYVSYLVERRDWLAGGQLTLADIVAAGQFSCIDYLTHIPWDRYPFAKSWYARIKSRPSFQPILKERLSQIPPSKIYDDLDF